MCGRYGFSVDVEEVRKMVREVERNQSAGGAPVLKTGEIFPTDTMPILIAGDRSVPASWGLPNPFKKGVIINARAETASEKPMFRKLLFGQRCVVPSTGFYEWNEEKQRFLFSAPDTPMLYMAGLYDQRQDGLHFVILTTGANSSVSDIHNRMPVLLTESNRTLWVNDAKSAVEILGQTPFALVREAI